MFGQLVQERWPSNIKVKYLYPLPLEELCRSFGSWEWIRDVSLHKTLHHCPQFHMSEKKIGELYLSKIVVGFSTIFNWEQNTTNKCISAYQSSTIILYPGNSRESQLHFFSLDYEKWFSKVSISSQNTRITICNLVLISIYENGNMIFSVSSHHVTARKIILDLVSKNAPSLECESEILNPTQLQGLTTGHRKLNDMKEIIRKMHEKLRWIFFYIQNVCSSA